LAGGIWQYLGTLAILVGYALVCVGASRAVLNGHLQVAKWRAIVPALAALLVAYTLYNQLVPAPAMPYRLFPYITLAWLVIGAAVVVFAPRMATRVGDGLTRALGLPALGADRTPAAVAEDPPAAV
jgi:hypothetical protein